MADEAVGTIAAKVRKLASDNSKTISDDEIEQFTQRVAQRNEEAKKAQQEYQTKSEEYVAEAKAERRKAYTLAASTAVGVPMLWLLLGLGIAWVRRGFKAM